MKGHIPKEDLLRIRED
jgi:hypothetical protein